MYGLLYECKFLTIEETNKKKKEIQTRWNVKIPQLFMKIIYLKI